MFDDDIDEDDLPQRRTDEVLTLLLARMAEGLAGKRLERLRRAEADLRACVEADAPPLLTTPELALLDLERQFRPEGVVARVASVDALLFVLPVFLERPRWQGADDVDRRMRIKVAADLARGVAGLPELQGADISCALLHVEHACRQARERLRREQAERASDSVRAGS